MMDSIINTVTSNKILLIILILITSIIIYSVLKRLIKIIVILTIALVLYLGYVHYSGENVDPRIQNCLNNGAKELKVIEQEKNRISDIINQAGKGAK